MNDELECILKEVVVAWNLPGGKTMKIFHQDTQRPD
jgi:hypothetical protein